MPKFTQKESDILSYLAGRPDDFAHYMSQLSEAAKEVALVLARKTSGPPEALAIAETIWTCDKKRQAHQKASDSADRDQIARQMDRWTR